MQSYAYFIDGCLTGNGIDYDSGPYIVKFTKSSTVASFNVTITKDSIFEKEETFFLHIPATFPSASTYHVTRSSPYTATVTIVDTACK